MRSQLNVRTLGSSYFPLHTEASNLTSRTRAVLSFFKRRLRFGDLEKGKFSDAIALMLRAQLAMAGVEPITASCKLQALGYIYGFIDAALRTIGQDMADNAVGIPVTFQVLRELFPGKEQEYLTFLRERVGRDDDLMSAMMYGGQQYLDFNNRKLAAPMGLSKIILGAA